MITFIKYFPYEMGRIMFADRHLQVPVELVKPLRAELHRQRALIMTSGHSTEDNKEGFTFLDADGCEQGVLFWDGQACFGKLVEGPWPQSRPNYE